MIPLWLALVSVVSAIVGLFYAPILGVAFAVVVGLYGHVTIAVTVGTISVIGWIISYAAMKV